MPAPRCNSRAIVVLGATWIALAACDVEHAEPSAPPGFPAFVEVSREAGIDFAHQRGATPTRYLIETMGGGVAVLDFDGDGRQDLYFVDSGDVPNANPRKPAVNRLYRNLGGLRFEDVTERAGVAGRGYMMGAIAGDYDADGDADLFVTGAEGVLLYRNRGDGSFEDATGPAGLEHDGWSTGAAFLDFDRDGRLDLFVQHYVQWDLARQRAHTQGRVPVHPAPDLFEPCASRLFRNRGDGTFEDASAASGIDRMLGKGLGVVTADLDDDGDPDLYCANDTERNFVLENRGDGTFREVGLVSGAAYGADGRAHSGMGVDASDLDGDGKLDLVVTNYQNEPNTIFRGEGRLRFTEISARSGTAEAALRCLGFGVRLADLDCDGNQDLVVANGHVQDLVAELEPGVTWAQPPLLFRGLGTGRFEDVLERQPEEFRRPRIGRGLAAADLDDDGDLDLLLGVLGDRAAVFENRGGSARSWLVVRCVGTRRDSTAIGTRVTVECGGRMQLGEVKSGASYLSQSDLRLHFGLGDAEKVDRVTVRWPDGAVEEARDVPARRRIVFLEGRGRTE